MLFRVVSVALWMAASAAGSAVAEDLGGDPAELPPASFRGPQYVDSRGCVFLRAGYGGNVTWVPRVTRERKPLCGYPPSYPEAPAEAAPPQAPAAAAEAAPRAVPEATVPPPAAAVALMPPVTPAPSAPTVPAPVGGLESPTPVPLSPASALDAAPAPAAKASGARGPSVAVADAVTTAIAEAQPKRPARKAQPSRGAVSHAAPVVVHPADRTEALVLRRLTLRRDEVRAAADLPSTVFCPATAPVPRRFATVDGGSTLLCIQPGQDLRGARIPALSPDDMAQVSRPPAVAGQVDDARYVQVGAFMRSANAAGARGRLAALGLPVAVAEGGPLEIVLAGPFGDPATARAALKSARRAGFAEAFLR